MYVKHTACMWSKFQVCANLYFVVCLRLSNQATQEDALYGGVFLNSKQVFGCWTQAALY